jgi:chromosome segregation ATPase
MLAIFRTSKMIGEERRQISALTTEMHQMRATAEDLQSSVDRLDARISVTKQITAAIEARCAFLQDAEAAASRGIQRNEDVSQVQALHAVVQRRQAELRTLKDVVAADEQAILQAEASGEELHKAAQVMASSCHRLAADVALQEELLLATKAEIERAEFLAREIDETAAVKEAQLPQLAQSIQAERLAAAALQMRTQRDTASLRTAEEDLSSVVAAIESFCDEKAELEAKLAQRQRSTTGVEKGDSAQRKAVEPAGEEALLAATVLSTSTPLKKLFAECKARFDASPVTKRFVQRLQ